MSVDLRANPFYLDDEGIQWVEDTIASMTAEEKIGQLFFNMGSSRTEEYLKMTVDKYHIGGIRYNPATAAEVHEQNRILQENSKIPLIIACNTEKGGNGACVDGTYIAEQTKIGATGDVKYAKALGKMSNTEAAAIGCNLSFAPVSDIYYNWHNPTLYFLNSENALTGERRILELYEGQTLAENLVAALLEGPQDRELSRALPEDFQINFVRMENGVCYVNISAASLGALPEDEDRQRMMLWSLTDSLYSIDSVEELHLLADGEEMTSFGIFSLD